MNWYVPHCAILLRTSWIFRWLACIYYGYRQISSLLWSRPLMVQQPHYEY